MLQDLVEQLLKKLPDAILSVEVDTNRAELAARVKATHILEVARFLICFLATRSAPMPLPMP